MTGAGEPLNYGVSQQFEQYQVYGEVPEWSNGLI